MRALRAKWVLKRSSHNEFDLFFTHHGLRGPINNHDLESVLSGILIASRLYGKHAARVACKVFYCKDINQNVRVRYGHQGGWKTQRGDLPRINCGDLLEFIYAWHLLDVHLLGLRWLLAFH